MGLVCVEIQGCLETSIPRHTVLSRRPHRLLLALRHASFMRVINKRHLFVQYMLPASRGATSCDVPCITALAAYGTPLGVWPGGPYISGAECIPASGALGTPGAVGISGANGMPRCCVPFCCCGAITAVCGYCLACSISLFLRNTGLFNKYSFALA